MNQWTEGNPQLTHVQNLLSNDDTVQELVFARRDLHNTNRFPTSNHIRALTFTDCKLGANEISNMLASSYLLQTLNLSHNMLDNEAAAMLGAFLETNTNLHEMYLQFNNIGEKGALALFVSLTHNSTLTVLNLENNQIQLHTQEFIVPLQQCPVHMLALSGNPLCNAGLTVLSQALHYNTAIKWLYLSSIQVHGVKGVAAMALALGSNNTTLEQLVLSGNEIDDEGAYALARTLEFNSTLAGLDLRRNSFTLVATQHFVHALLMRPREHMIDIDLSDVHAEQALREAVLKAALARQIFALRTAMEIKRVAQKSALRKLPLELTRMVAWCLHNMENLDGDLDETMTL